MAEQKKNSVLGGLTDEELAAVKAAKSKQRSESTVEEMWVFLAKLAQNFGFDAVRSFENTEFDFAFYDNLLKGADVLNANRKIDDFKIYRAAMISNSEELLKDEINILESVR